MPRRCTAIAPEDDDEDGRQEFIRQIARQSQMPHSQYANSERQVERAERRRLQREHEHPHEWDEEDVDD